MSFSNNLSLITFSLFSLQLVQWLEMDRANAASTICCSGIESSYYDRYCLRFDDSIDCESNSNYLCEWTQDDPTNCPITTSSGSGSGNEGTTCCYGIDGTDVQDRSCNPETVQSDCEAIRICEWRCDDSASAVFISNIGDDGADAVNRDMVVLHMHMPENGSLMALFDKYGMIVVVIACGIVLAVIGALCFYCKTLGRGDSEQKKLVTTKNGWNDASYGTV